MDSFVEIHHIVPLYSDISDLQFWLMFFCWVLSIIAIFYAWFVGFDPEAIIRDGANALLGVAAALPIAAVRIDDIDQAESQPSNLPTSAVQAGMLDLQPPASPAATTRFALPPPPKKWSWEQPGYAGRPGRFSTHEEIQLPALKDRTLLEYALSRPTQAAQRRLREKQRHEAGEKLVDDFWFGLATETPLPPPQGPQRKFLQPPPGYQIVYEKFRSVFGPGAHNNISSQTSHEYLDGYLHTGINEILPGRPAEIDHTNWTRPNTVHPPIPGAMNGSHSPRQANKWPAGNHTGTTTIAPPENGQRAPLQPAPQHIPPPSNGGQIVASHSGNPPPRPPPSVIPVATPGSAPVRSAPANQPSAPRQFNPVPPPRSSNSVLIPFVMGGGTAASAQQSGGTPSFGDATAPTATDNKLLQLTDVEALNEIDRSMDRIFDTIKKICNSVQKSGGKAAWKANTQSSKAKNTISDYAKSLNDICDWAARPDGRVDEVKLPRSTWQQYGLGANDLGNLTTILQKGCEFQPEVLDVLWKAANRAKNLFK